MMQQLENQLHEQQRDALVGYLLGQVMRRDSVLGAKVKTVDDLYEHLLIDPMVTRKVTTSPVAEAIASVQQYINRIAQRREPGLSMAADELADWQGSRGRYAVWAAERQLAAYPENTLDPALREGKSALFVALENELQQGRLTAGTVQKAVLNYLNEFEKLSNLKILSAWQDGTEAASDVFIFVARNRTAPHDYYWRTFDASRRAPDGERTLDAWSEWRKIDLPLGNLPHGQALRPVRMNGRLYLAWYEINVRKNEKDAETSRDAKFHLAFCRYDNTWAEVDAIEVADFDPENLVAAVRQSGKDTEASLWLCGHKTAHRKGSGHWYGVRFDRLQHASDATASDHSALIAPYVSGTGSDSAFAPFAVQQPALGQAPKLCSLGHAPGDADDAILFLQDPSRNKIRLATRFAKDLIERANASLDDLFDWHTQGLTEPALPGQVAAPIDFHGPYGLYFWELFFHLPWLVASRCNLEHRFDEARRWLHVIFTPHGKAGRYWQVRPLMGAGRAAQRAAGHRGVASTASVSRSSYGNAADNPHVDPHAIALAAPVHYRKAIFFAYLKNLIDTGDARYRELSRDGLNEAKQWYMMARDLLGKRPDTDCARRWTPMPLSEAARAAQGGQSALRLLDGVLDDAFVGTRDSERPAGKKTRASRPSMMAKAAASNAGSVSTRRPPAADPALRAFDNGAFSLPQNLHLQQQWRALDTRLHNLRHHLTLDGKPLSLPLFDAPLAASDLLAQRGRGAGLARGGAMAPLAVPPFRFAQMIARANMAAESLMQFGRALQNALERKDATHLELLQMTQQRELLAFTADIAQQTIDMGRHSETALRTSEQAATERHDHYKGLYDENISSGEIAAMAVRGTADLLVGGAHAAFALGNLLDIAPNIFGLSNGGMRWGGAGYAVGNTLFSAAAFTGTAARVVETTQQYARRRQEWAMQYKQAASDKAQIGHQIAAQQQQIAIYERQLEQIQKQQAQVQATLAFLSSRFTGEALYQWLAGQLSALYFQAYDAVMALCLSTEAAWRYETGQFGAPSFIGPGAWSDLYSGLLAGEKLKLGLQRMEQAWLTRHERKLEIVHTVSLKQLIGERLGEAQWQAKLDALRTQGKLAFELSERDFAERYPGHYLRQIAAVTVSLPAVVGPYQDVCATLTQTGSAMTTAPDIEAVKYLLYPASGSPANVRRNLRAAQQVALSTGFNDAGMFVLNFGDERYLPFEGTGAASHWELQFPNPQRAAQASLLNNLTDVIVRIRYTARDGGPSFAQQVGQTIEQQGGAA